MTEARRRVEELLRGNKELLEQYDRNPIIHACLYRAARGDWSVEDALAAAAVELARQNKVLMDAEAERYWRAPPPVIVVKEG